MNINEEKNDETNDDHKSSNDGNDSNSKKKRSWRDILKEIHEAILSEPRI